MIYFAQLPTGAIKIGCSANVEQRIASLERFYHQPLALLHTMEGNRQTEREIHARFAHLRFTRHRGPRGRKPEQFRPGPDLMEFIGLPVLVSANPELIESVQPKTDGLFVRLVIPADIHRDFRVLAAKRGVGMAVLASRIIVEFVQAKRKEGRL